MNVLGISQKQEAWKKYYNRLQAEEKELFSRKIIKGHISRPITSVNHQTVNVG